MTTNSHLNTGILGSTLSTYSIISDIFVNRCITGSPCPIPNRGLLQPKHPMLELQSLRPT